MKLITVALITEEIKNFNIRILPTQGDGVTMLLVENNHGRTHASFLTREDDEVNIEPNEFVSVTKIEESDLEIVRDYMFSAFKKKFMEETDEQN